MNAKLSVTCSSAQGQNLDLPMEEKNMDVL